jgi:hypothetical protein
VIDEGLQTLGVGRDPGQENSEQGGGPGAHTGPWLLARYFGVSLAAGAAAPSAEA